MGGREPLEVRLWKKVNKTNSCWLWTGATSTGYGYFEVNHVRLWVHRVSLELEGQIIPQGMVVDHICRNRACVRPEHLRIVTERVNATENSSSAAAKNAAKTACMHGHPFSDENTSNYDGHRKCKACAKVAQERRKQGYKSAPRRPNPTEQELRVDLAEGLNWIRLGLKYGVTDNAVRKWAKKYALI